MQLLTRDYDSRQNPRGMTQSGPSNCSYTSYSDMTRDTIDAKQANQPGSLYTVATIVTCLGLEHAFRAVKCR